MYTEGRISWLNQIENTDKMFSLKTEAPQVDVAPVNYDAGDKQQQ